MIEAELLGRAGSARQQVKREKLRWYSAYFSVMAVGVIFAGLAWTSAPDAFSIAVAALLLTAVAWIVSPTVGMHLTLLFTLFGDTVTISWFPFTKNLSSQESLLYISDAIIFSPLELILAFGLVCWLVRHLANREHPVVFGPLFAPLLVFTGFVFTGLIYGVGTGGDRHIALFECRNLFYMPIIYFLVSNTCHTPRQYRNLLWTAMVAVTGQAIMSMIYALQLSDAERDDLEALGEHGASVAFSALFIFLIASLLFRGASRRGRFALGIMAMPVLFSFLAAQRRAAFVGLAAAIVALCIVLFWRQRRTFWKVVPLLAIVATGYVGAFWNSTGSAGFPAQAVKSVIAPEALSEADRSSDLYRVIENFDLNYTIRQKPLTGFGFGHPFLQPVTLPDISFFAYYQYIPHNSMLWIWIQTGIFGFVALFFLFGRSLALGARTLRSLTEPDDVTVVVTATMFVLMYAVFCYVDIGWDARGTVFLAFAMAICANFPYVRPETTARPKRRLAEPDRRIHDLPQLAPSSAAGRPADLEESSV